MNVLMLVGSLREDSWTARVTRLLASRLPEDSVEYADLATLPHYDEDLDTDTPPASVAALRRAIAEADALVVATPEYNGSVSSALKNAIDWASRPHGEAALAGKPVAVISVSPSPRGGQWAREDAVRILGVAGAQPLTTTIGVAAVHEVLGDEHAPAVSLLQELGALADDLLEAAQTTEAPAA